MSHVNVKFAYYSTEDDNDPNARVLPAITMRGGSFPNAPPPPSYDDDEPRKRRKRRKPGMLVFYSIFFF